jgi:hypothetical protein
MRSMKAGVGIAPVMLARRIPRRRRSSFCARIAPQLYLLQFCKRCAQPMQISLEVGHLVRKRFALRARCCRLFNRLPCISSNNTQIAG